jgi:hypothetical protein
MEQAFQSANRRHRDWTHPNSVEVVRPQIIWTLGAVTLLALGLRLVFIFHVSTIPIIWDAEIYWNLAVKIRNLICTDLHVCVSAAPAITWAEVVRSVTISREGLPPLFFGSLLTFLPVDPKSIYVLIALMDSLVCLMAMKIVVRCGGPLWVSALTGLAYACYIPVVVGTGAFLQQPFIRFWLTATVFAYALVFTSSDDRQSRRFHLAGTVASLVLGFSSTTTHPLMWIGPVTTALIAFRYDCSSFLRKRLPDIGALVILLVLIFAVTRAFVADISSLNLASLVATGLPIDNIGGDQLQTTVLSFRDFWPPSDWYPNNVPFHTKSLFQDFFSSPGAFGLLWIYSIFGNWVYPDHLYFQAFILDLGQQNIEHLIISIAGLVGLSFMLGSRGVVRKIGILIWTFVLFVSLTNAVISVEPRRLSVLAPLWSIGLGYCLWTMRSWPRARLAGIVVLTAISILLWRLRPAILLYLPISTALAFNILMVARIAVTLILAWYLTQTRRAVRPAFSRGAPPLIAMTACIAVVAIALFQDTEWREWSTTVSGKIRQTIVRADHSQGAWPWLLVDVDPAHAASLSISINGERVKDAGTPMQIWEAGVPPSWQPYGQRAGFANTNVSRAMWSAIPIPNQLAAADTLTVELDAAGPPFSIGGDLADPDDPLYSGPLFAPWVTGHSMWRWIWNASDPRIPRTRTLPDRYVSARFNGQSWDTRDLSPELGRQNGRFRILITDAAFGPRTNALSSPLEPGPLPECRSGIRIAAVGEDIPFICQQGDGSLDYFVDNDRAGRSERQTLLQAPPDGEVVERLESTAGRIEVRKVLNTTYVANFYDSASALRYSLAFRMGP